MKRPTTEIIEQISIDGPIGLWPAVAVGAALAVAFAWLLWSQRRAIGRWTVTFWTLRVIATGLVLWMLLGPSWVTRQTSITPHSVAILVDTSDSMDVSDPLNSARQWRWTQSASGGPAVNDPLIHCDRATVALQSTTQRCRQAGQAVARHQSADDVRHQFDLLQQSVERTIAHLESALTTTDEPREEATGRTERVLTLLQGQVLHDLHDITRSFEGSEGPAAREVTEALLSLEDVLAGAERRLSELTRVLERSVTDNNTSTTSDSSAGLSRREHVARTLAAVQKLTASDPKTTVTIQPVRFDERATVAALDDGWNRILQSTETISPSAGTNESAGRSALTSISAALDQLSRTASAEPVVSAILITDGGHNDSSAAAPQEVAATLGNIPVHVVPIGHTQLHRDLLLHRVDVPTVVVENDSISIDIIVTAFQCAGESSRLVLKKDGAALDEQLITFDRDRIDHRTFFQVPADELGRHEFELTLEPLEDEANTANNVAHLTVNVVRDTLRVLLADRIARWEYRYLEQLFRRDESITFDRLLFQPEVRASGEIASTGRLPRDVEGWSRYDVVILGDLDPQQLNAESQEALSEFVQKRGGQLVVIGGGEQMPGHHTQLPLMDLLPVTRTRRLASADSPQIALTTAGRSHAALTLAETPKQSEQVWQQQYRFLPLTSLSEYSRPRPTAETLIAVTPSGQPIAVESPRRTPDHALLCWHQVGAGRVVCLSSPSTYHLRCRRGDRYHHLFWGQMLRWLTAAERSVGTQLVRVSTDRVHYQQGSPIDVTVRLSDDNGSPLHGATPGVTAESDEGPAVSMELTADERVPGRYFGSLTGLSPGAWRITPTGTEVERLLSGRTTDAPTEAVVTVAASGSPEQQDTRCNVALLQQIAEVTGGQVLPPTAIDEVLRLSSAGQDVIERVERQALWNRWSLLVVAFGCLCTEWIVRKRLGLA